MEELEEMEPGLTTRFDEEWERTFYKKKKSVLPIGDGTKQKVRNSAKRWAHDGTRTRTHVSMSERSDPIHQDREGTSHQAQSLVRQNKPSYTMQHAANTTANTKRRAANTTANTTANTQPKAHIVIRSTTTAMATKAEHMDWR
jgi:hypothetical protein